MCTIDEDDLQASRGTRKMTMKRQEKMKNSKNDLEEMARTYLSCLKI